MSFDPWISEWGNPLDYALLLLRNNDHSVPRGRALAIFDGRAQQADGAVLRSGYQSVNPSTYDLNT
jgi:hypothetical protein